MDNIKIISFDVEGTLTTTDFSYAIWFEALQEAYADKYSISIEKAKSTVMSQFQKVENQGLESNDINYWFRKFDLSSPEVVMKKYKNRVQYYPEVKEVLISLDRKYRLTIASGTPRNALGYLLNDIAYYFTDTFSSITDYGQLKTPEFYDEMCRTLKVRPDEVAHIGDNWEHDCLAAREIGIHTFYLDRTGQVSKEESFKDLISIKSLLMK
jgi:putative hydrolase of the HAD superfamily